MPDHRHPARGANQPGWSPPDERDWTGETGSGTRGQSRTSRRETDRKARRAWRIAGWGTLIVGGGLTTIAAAAGLGGRAGLRFFLLGGLLACALGALYALGSGAMDAVRGRRTGRDRVVAAVVLGALATLLPAMVIGLAD